MAPTDSVDPGSQHHQRLRAARMPTDGDLLRDSEMVTRPKKFRRQQAKDDDGRSRTIIRHAPKGMCSQYQRTGQCAFPRTQQLFRGPRNPPRSRLAYCSHQMTCDAPSLRDANATA